MARFSWNQVYKRRLVLAEAVSGELGLTSFGLSRGVRQAYDPGIMTAHYLADEPMCRVPFLLIGHRMRELMDGDHVIDHAWWLIADASPYEPWGFVTEPYVRAEDAAAMAAALSRRLQGWPVRIKVWPCERSAWVPGRTVPIVTTVEDRSVLAFLRLGVGAALRDMSGTDWLLPEASELAARLLAHLRAGRIKQLGLAEIEAAAAALVEVQDDRRYRHLVDWTLKFVVEQSGENG